jgi:hypothetical protein
VVGVSNAPRFFQYDAAYRDELRREFEPAQVGKLPRITKKDGVESWCDTCRQKLKPHIHIDFVGHANVTDRLNHVAPDWSYTIDHIETVGGHIAGIQGTMTIGGKSLPESGALDRPGPWGEELKLAISDFICRGAMRFGVGLDLWIKGEAAKYDEDVEAEARAVERPAPSDTPPPASDGEPGSAASTTTPPMGISGEKRPAAGAEAVSPLSTSASEPGAPSASKEQLERLVSIYGGQAKAIRAAWDAFGLTSKDLPSLVYLDAEQAERLILAVAS